MIDFFAKLSSFSYSRIGHRIRPHDFVQVDRKSNQTSADAIIIMPIFRTMAHIIIGWLNFHKRIVVQDFSLANETVLKSHCYATGMNDGKPSDSPEDDLNLQMILGMSAKSFKDSNSNRSKTPNTRAGNWNAKNKSILIRQRHFLSIIAQIVKFWQITPPFIELANSNKRNKTTKEKKTWPDDPERTACRVTVIEVIQVWYWLTSPRQPIAYYYSNQTEFSAGNYGPLFDWFIFSSL